MTSEPIPEARPASPSYSLPELPSKSSPPDSQSSSEGSDDASSDSGRPSSADRPQRWPPEDIVFPEVIISAFTETGQAESSIKVPLQRSYTGQDPVISSSLADTPCVTLGVQGVLNGLNATLRTSYTLDNPSLLSIIEDCVEKDYDFGTAYGRLRQIWYTDDWSTIRHELHRREEEDKEKRRKALVGNRIIHIFMPPRRVWDLYSNRVVPYWVSNTSDSSKLIRPISHAWVADQDRVGVWTSINNKEWPVPIPKDANLDLIRIEMLNLRLEYAWLDVLCLRQQGGMNEDERANEWALDVPTIGRVYRVVGLGVVIYLSGLGLPLTVKEGDLDSDRSWFRRAWTLQEAGSGRIIAGDMPDGPMHAKPIDEDGIYETELLTRFHKRLISTQYEGAFGHLMEMQIRVSTNAVDKIAGLAFTLLPLRLPAYYESESLEDAWTALLNSISPWRRVLFLVLYPAAGLGQKKWRPTWKQVMTETLPEDEFCNELLERDDEMDEDWLTLIYCIENGYVRGLDVESAEGVDRCGELVAESTDGIPHTFSIRATDQILIPEDAYTLLGCNALNDNDKIWRKRWVVGRRLPGKRFEKVSVVVMDDEIPISTLKDLGITTFPRNTLI